MTERGDAQRNPNNRGGLSRWMVPHDTFDWYIRAIGLSALAFSALTGVVSWAYHMQLFDALGLANETGGVDLLARYGRLSMLASGVIAITMALFITVVAMFLFHRVVGPVYRMKQHMIAVANGEEVGALRIRETDQLGDVCDAYNQMLLALDVIDADKPESDA